MKSAKILLSVILLCSCATTPEQRYSAALKKANCTPHDLKPALYQRLVQKGDINQVSYKQWMEGWQKSEKAIQANRVAQEKQMRLQREKEERWWNSLSPAQQASIKMQEKHIQLQYAQMQWQQEQQRRAAVSQAIGQSLDRMNQSLQHQSEVSAYNARTQAMMFKPATEVNVNINNSGMHTIPRLGQTFY